MIEFCREKIIMANNPECKTYEEALEKEAKNEISCQLSLKGGAVYTICTESHRKSLRLGIMIGVNSCESCDCESCECGGFDNKPNPYDALGEIDTILGLPLTLERVLVSVSHLTCQLQILDAIYIKLNHIDYQKQANFSWQPNKTLEEQSDETIKSIAEILGYKE